MEAAGIEHPCDSSGNSAPHQRGAECGALDAESPAMDADLAAVVQAWAKLPGPIKAGILAMIRAAV